MKISTLLSTNPAQFEALPFKGNFEENVSAIKAIGFDGIELAVRDPLIIDQEGIIATIEAAGLEIPALGTGQAWGEEQLSFTDPDYSVREAAVERVFSHIPLAEKTGAVIIIGLLRGIVRPEVQISQARRWMLDCFIRCCRKAEDCGVRIAFEPINRYETSLLNTVESGLELITEVGGENLGMLLDTFHMNIEEPSIELSIRKAADRIFHFHYADSNRCYPGAGHLDFHAIISALKDVDFQGYLSGEHRPDPDPAVAARLGLEKIKQIIGELK